MDKGLLNGKRIRYVKSTEIISQLLAEVQVCLKGHLLPPLGKRARKLCIR